ncbi:MAG: 4Fe-4S dicluster domain-containing protein [Erysipelotrichaceae bacterium]|nr:4Fe-4S dicluster domain-containing protein [Erysipelotrichaceae bacterium]
MSTIEQMKDNISFIKDFKPFTDKKHEAVAKVRKIFEPLDRIDCTACRYYVDGCPMNISIPDLFGCYNDKMVFNDWSSGYYYGVHTKGKGKASDCIERGQCENMCPQKLPIIKLLKDVAATFE